MPADGTDLPDLEAPSNSAAAKTFFGLHTGTARHQPSHKAQRGSWVMNKLITKLAEYRDQATECQEIANRGTGLIKQQYEELARQWQALVERSEQIAARP
jgi:hypothetical protein